MNALSFTLSFSIFNQAFYALQDEAGSLTTLKKVLIVAIPILVALTAVYMICRSLLKQRKITKNIDNEKENLKALRETQKFYINHIATGLENAFKLFDVAKMNIDSAKCFLRINFKNNTLGKEFIFEKQDGTALDKQFFQQQMDKVKQLLENQIKENFGPFISLQWIAIFKDTQNHYYKHSDKCEILVPIDTNSSENLLYPKMNKNLLNVIIRDTVYGEMNFPIEVQIQNDKFTRGRRYQALN